MAALIPLDTFYLGQVAALTNGANRPTIPVARGGTLHVLRTQYTLLGTEAANDTLAAVYLPKGVLLQRNSFVECLDPGTTLTLDIGITGDADVYADGMTLSAGGLITFGSTLAGAAANLAPTVTTDETLITVTIASANTLTAGVILYFNWIYAQY